MLSIYYSKKGEFMQLSSRSFRLATNSLTGNWKPGGESIPSAPLALEKSKKTIGSYLTPPVLLKSLRD
jgi:hypothetical protein